MTMTSDLETLANLDPLPVILRHVVLGIFRRGDRQTVEPSRCRRPVNDRDPRDTLRKQGLDSSKV